MKKYLNTHTILLITLIISINILSGYLNINIDLTSDKLHSISSETKNIINKLDDRIFIKVYLEGEFPAEFKHLQNATYNLLKRLKELSPDLIDFEFINPTNAKNNEEKIALFKQLVNQGLAPTDLEIRNMESSKNQIIFPGAIIYYKEKHIAVNFLNNQITNSAGDNINSSIENLEYEFVSSITHITRKNLDKIAFLEGNGELNENQVYDITKSVMNDNFNLSYFFNVERFNIKEFELDTKTMEPSVTQQIQLMNQYKAIIIAKPTIPFNNIDKFLIDQYIMNGGKILWLIDGMNATMDSLRFSKSFIALANDLNISNQLFKYGVRINSNLIEDLRAVEIPIITGYSNNIPQQSFFRWPYHPLLFSQSNHPISKNLDAIRCNFVSSIDTIKNNIKKTILLHSSSKTRLIPSPVKVSLNILENPPLHSSYNKKNQAIAVLLEGEFQSIFKNRILPKKEIIPFKEESEKNKMIIISDGDLISNDVGHNGTIYPLGYDKFIEYSYPGNKIFIINCLQYLCDNIGVSNLKRKTLQLRMLDKQKTNNYKYIIEIINIVLPLILLSIFMIYNRFHQKKKYA